MEKADHGDHGGNHIQVLGQSLVFLCRRFSGPSHFRFSRRWRVLFIITLNCHLHCIGGDMWTQAVLDSEVVLKVFTHLRQSGKL